MRSVALLIPLLVGGCYSTHPVAAPQLGALHTGHRTREIVVGAWGSRTRIGPHSRLRFVRTDGTRTPWVAGDALRVNAEGVFLRHTVPLAAAVGARVTGLDAVGVADLQAVAPAGCLVVDNGGGALDLWFPDGSALVAWIENVALAGHAYSGAMWTIELPGQQVVGPTPGDRMRDLARGVVAMDGIAWRDVKSAQINNMSGALTLGGITSSVAALSASLTVDLAACMATLGRGCRAPATELTSRVIGHAAFRRPRGAPGDGPTLAQAGAAAPSPAGAVMLFTRGARRRAIIRALAWADASATQHRTEPLSGSVGGGVRIADFLEVGGGVRHFVVGAAGETRAASGTAGYGRVGLHLDLDAARRVALTLGTDFGGGSAGSGVGGHFRLDFGLRVRATRRVSLGLAAVNPTYTRFRGGGGPRRWSYQSGLEALVSY